jgi:uncharacterized OsmC-like protein
MEYSITANSSDSGVGEVDAKNNHYTFGISKDHKEMAGPVEILLSAFAACCLKNVERFSSILNFPYEHAQIKVKGIRQDKPPLMKEIIYTLEIKSSDNNLNIDLLHKNIQKFGTIYNTLNQSSAITGEIKLLK